MKIQMIFSLFKKTKRIHIHRDRRRCFVSNGVAAYAIPELPELDETQLRLLAGIPDEKSAEYDIEADAQWMPILNDDEVDYSQQAERRPMQYISDGTVKEMLVDKDGNVAMFDSKYLRPLLDYDDLSYYFDEGYIKVKAGFLLAAVIVPIKISKEVTEEIGYISSLLNKGGNTMPNSSDTVEEIKLDNPFDFEDTITTVAVFLKQVVRKAKEQGITDEYIEASLRTVKNYAIGIIPEN